MNGMFMCRWFWNHVRWMVKVSQNNEWNMIQSLEIWQKMQNYAQHCLMKELRENQKMHHVFVKYLFKLKLRIMLCSLWKHVWMSIRTNKIYAESLNYFKLSNTTETRTMQQILFNNLQSYASKCVSCDFLHNPIQFYFSGTYHNQTDNWKTHLSHGPRAYKVKD